MKRYAVVNPESFVANIIVWDEVSPWQPPEGHTMIKAEDIVCDIGWKHENGVFTDPNPPVEPEQAP